jgi:hypothetical protein
MALDIIFIRGVYFFICIFVRHLLLFCENEYVWVLPDVVCTFYALSSFHY